MHIFETAVMLIMYIIFARYIFYIYRGRFKPALLTWVGVLLPLIPYIIQSNVTIDDIPPLFCIGAVTIMTVISRSWWKVDMADILSFLLFVIFGILSSIINFYADSSGATYTTYWTALIFSGISYVSLLVPTIRKTMVEPETEDIVLWAAIATVLICSLLFNINMRGDRALTTFALLLTATYTISPILYIVYTIYKSRISWR